MPNPFLTPNKKGRYQDNKRHSSHASKDHGREVQGNPFLCNKPNNINSFSEQKCVQPSSPAPVPPSFEELFPSLSQTSTLSNNQTPKLNFKHAVQGSQAGQASIPIQTPIQINHPQQQLNHQSHEPHQTQIRQNQFLRPTNQFLHPTNQFLRPMNNMNNDVRHYRRNDYDDDDYADGNNDNNDAYDSAYTKYYQD